MFSLSKYRHDNLGKVIMIAKTQEVQWSDDDVVNPNEYTPEGEYNPYNVRPWVLHDHGFVVAVVLADSLQDAIDIAVDEDKMDRYLISPENMGDYEDEEGISFLGNASEAFDIETLRYIELQNQKENRSLAALYQNGK
jgi:hypothetical protein